MGKTAFMFPGQGAQYSGMGKDFYDAYDQVKEIFKIANEAGEVNLEDLIFTENENLNITEYTQIAMLAVEVAILKVAQEKGLKADVCAGLSLGEYGALAAADVMELSDLFSLIRKRGIYMQKAYPEGGAMTAVLGLDAKAIEEACAKIDGIVSIANYNCPGQIVITGQAQAVEAAAALCSEAGAKRCIPLKVSGPFHSALLENAGQQLGQALADVTVKKPSIPYLCNVEADYVTQAEPVKELLQKQVSSSVRWEQSVRKMLADGVDTFIEIGPGKTLSGFMKKIDKEVKCMNIATIEDMEKVLAELE